jgi:hypothetical protein
MYYLLSPFSYCHTNVINICTVSGLNLSSQTGYPDRYFVTLLQASKHMLRIFFNRLHYKCFMTHHRSHSTPFYATYITYFKNVVALKENQPIPSQIHQILPNSLVPLMFATKTVHWFYTAVSHKLNPLILHSCKFLNFALTNKTEVVSS